MSTPLDELQQMLAMKVLTPAERVARLVIAYLFAAVKWIAIGYLFHCGWRLAG